MFETLFAKTFVILASQLFITWLTAAATIATIRRAYLAGSTRVTATETKNDQLDLHLDWSSIKGYFYALLIVDIAVFLALMFLGRQNLNIGLPLFTVWSALTGIEVALALISVDENLGAKVVAITATITCAAGLIGMYSGIDFAFLGTILFIALMLLIVGNLVRLFISIPRASQRTMAFFGAVIFTGYLLYDFNRLSKLGEHAGANNWRVAMDLAISIYLDIINLFLQLLDLLSD